MERTPVDGVMCVVWFGKGVVIFARFDACHNAWCEGSGIMRSHKYVTHWTTLDEAKAAPELVEVSRAAMEHLCQDPSPTCCESAACRIAIGDALAKIGDTHATH
jgi:hypothetical protein